MLSQYDRVVWFFFESYLVEDTLIAILTILMELWKLPIFSACNTITMPTVITVQTLTNHACITLTGSGIKDKIILGNKIIRQ